MRQIALPPVGLRLRELREQCGVTTQEVCTAVGITSGALSAIERGVSIPSLRVICLLAREYQAPLDTLFSEKPVDRDAQVRSFAAEFSGRLQREDWIALRAVAGRLACRH